jgi:hypothetical protein
MVSFNVLSSGMGQWGYVVIDQLLERAFPTIVITHNKSENPDLVVLSHFLGEEDLQFDCPYVTYSAEPYHVKPAIHDTPLCEVNTFDCDDSNCVYFPLLAADSKSVRPESFATDKKYCCAFAFTNPVKEREALFRQLRTLEPTCYAFGSSCATPDKPFELSRDNRFQNARAFRNFGFVVAMENTVKAGYITEKIGMAFESGTVPIYDSRNGVERFFNTESFFDVALYNSPVDAAVAAVEVWKDKQKLQRYLDAPIRVNGNLAEYENLEECKEARTWMMPFVRALREQFPDL